ncbi:hypothetical protein DPEC_G00164520 [Dallia pectoralis]|uniref:Uncharacterized protein n=1 Tax=Dallia pectoralis TaxID=75939 RepID=A0ACC2GH29_DALPE|nr:hypothetical protein DPEC_G00164520 [Dallia pectoralis]
MLNVRIGKRMRRTNGVKCLLTIIAGIAILFFAFFLIMQSQTLEHSLSWSEWFPGSVWLQGPKGSKENFSRSGTAVNPCGIPKPCLAGNFSFLIFTGAANAVGPKICIENKLVMGAEKQNTGAGINIAVVNGKTGAVIKTDYFDMYGGEVEPLIEFLKSIETGSVVLMATFDDPASKLNEEAKQLIRQLGSSVIDTLGFRDNWVFVGGKAAEGANIKSTLEKHIKNIKEQNKYDDWPEMIELEGCIPYFLNDSNQTHW